MIELNLLPDVKKEFIRAQRSRNRVISIAIVAILITAGGVIAAALMVYGGQTLVIGGFRDEIKKNHTTLKNKPDINKYLAVQGQLKALDKLGDTRTIDSRLFDYLAQLNPKPPHNITLHTLTLDKSSTTMVVEGSAKTFETINNFIATLQKATISYKVDGQDNKTPFFTSVTADSPVLSSDNSDVSISFKITAVYDNVAFDAKSTDVKVEVPQMVISDSKENTPTFAAPAPIKQETGNGSN